MPETLYLEYKRGKWLDEDGTTKVREYVSGFANAEGGVLVIGIVGGEEAQGADKWSFEAPTLPDKAGWDAWLGRVLSEIITKTRVAYTVVSVDGADVIVIATNRAEELIRVYEKPNLVCYLRVGDNTVPIDETLFVDLALGRRAKPDLTIEQLKIEGSIDTPGFHLNVTFILHNQGLLWVPDLTAAWSGYAAGGTPASASLKRRLHLHPPKREAVVAVVGPVNVPTGAVAGEPKQVKPFEQVRCGMQIRGIPVRYQNGFWAWYAAVMVLPQNGSPVWAQLAVHGYADAATAIKAWALPAGTTPVLAWFEESEVPPSIEAFFGPSTPS